MILQEKEIKLATGATVSVDDYRVRVDLPPPSPRATYSSYRAISSALLNGGCHTFHNNSSLASPRSTITTHVINGKTPSTYDGLNPPPLGLLANFCKKERIDAANAVGLLTAASMQSLSMASRTAQGVTVDVLVTAGIGNSRSAGADADWFVVCENENGDEQEMTPGTINTIIIVNAPLTQEAQVEAYAIAIEAKCSACVNHGIVCAKDPTKLGMGTGTDCCALIAPCHPPQSNAKKGDNEKGAVRKIIKHAGKHTLFAEMIGQAVSEATSKAIMINIEYLHYNYATYTIRRWARILFATMKGSRVCVPPKPMDPIPNAPPSVLLLGICSVLLIYTSPLPDKAKLLLGAVAWDRYLGEPPVRFHPVCLAGNAISKVLSLTPEGVFKSPVQGSICGVLFLVSMLFVFLQGSWIFLQLTDTLALHGPIFVYGVCREYCSKTTVQMMFDGIAWILKLLLLKSAFSLQILCNLALQMARFLERDQIEDARAQLCWLCSRDPSKLNCCELSGGTLESLSENLSDGFVAPLFWYVLLGPLGAVGYRTANTMDSRIGYRGKYEWFGKASALHDDLINIFPARITALLLAFAAVFVRECDAKRGLRTTWKDRNQCDSPNAGYPMACFAGILGVQLSKEGEYCLGSGCVDPGPRNIRAGHQVALIAGGMAVVVATMAAAWDDQQTYAFGMKLV